MKVIASRPSGRHDITKKRMLCCQKINSYTQWYVTSSTSVINGHGRGFGAFSSLRLRLQIHHSDGRLAGWIHNRRKRKISWLQGKLFLEAAVVSQVQFSSCLSSGPNLFLYSPAGTVVLTYPFRNRASCAFNFHSSKDHVSGDNSRPNRKIQVGSTRCTAILHAELL